MLPPLTTGQTGRPAPIHIPRCWPFPWLVTALKVFVLGEVVSSHPQIHGHLVPPNVALIGNSVFLGATKLSSC